MTVPTRLPRPMTPPGVAPQENIKKDSKLSFGVVCSSNINRSMEGHVVLGNAGKFGIEDLNFVMSPTFPTISLWRKGLRVESYGTGTQVRLPGRSAMEPRIFKFGTPYEEMYKSMSATQDDAAFFARNGVLQLCRRGAAVKRAPQRWQDMDSYDIGRHDIAIAFEERIFDAVVEDLQVREPTEDFSPIHVICLDTKDNPHEAALQGRVALELCWLLEANADDLIVKAPEIVEAFQQERMTHTPIKVLYQLCYL